MDDSNLIFQVKIWFQNRRTKWKKQDNISNAEAAEHKNQNNPKTTPVKSKHSGTGVKEVDPLRPSVDCSSDSNNSLMISDVSVSDSDAATQRLLSVPTGPEISMHLSPNLGISTENHSIKNQRAMSPDSVYISTDYDTDLKLIGEDRLNNSGNLSIFYLLFQRFKSQFVLEKGEQSLYSTGGNYLHVCFDTLPYIFNRF